MIFSDLNLNIAGVGKQLLRSFRIEIFGNSLHEKRCFYQEQSWYHSYFFNERISLVATISSQMFSQEQFFNYL